MLNPNRDRQDYGRLLTPPDDYTLDFAVGSTYSLDLDALVGACLALGLSEETDSALKENPICLLETLRNMGDKIALFCQSGQIHLPTDIRPLYILLEKMVFPVRLSKSGRSAYYPSFHAKLWLIRYVSKEKGVKYRFIILSRNLTFDRSWDVACSMDGIVTAEKTEKNAPLCDFIQFLTWYLPTGETGRKKTRGIRSMLRELPWVRFELKDKDLRSFHDYEFIPGGVPKASGGQYRYLDTALFKQTFHEIFIISPFLSAKTVRNFNDRNARSRISGSRYRMITRDMSLAKLSREDVSNFEIFTVRDKILDGEEALSEDEEGIQRQDIHAKVYLLRKHTLTDLYLGSMNASENAVSRNVEFMLRLRTYRSNLNMDILSADLFGTEKDGSDNPFQAAELPETGKTGDEIKDTLLEEVLKAVCGANPWGEVTAEEDGNFLVCLHFGKVDTKWYQVRIGILFGDQITDFSSTVVFSGLKLTELSEFYVISVSNDDERLDRIMKIQTKNIPQSREKAIVANIIKDEDSFYRYIAYLLGDDSILSLLEAGIQSGKGGSGPWKTVQKPALYERMLRAAVNAPEKLEGIDYLLKTVDDKGVIPEKFKILYETFRKAVRKRG